jgi:hypothetical protein
MESRSPMMRGCRSPCATFWTNLGLARRQRRGRSSRAAVLRPRRRRPVHSAARRGARGAHSRAACSGSDSFSTSPCAPEAGRLRRGPRRLIPPRPLPTPLRRREERRCGSGDGARSSSRSTSRPLASRQSAMLELEHVGVPGRLDRAHRLVAGRRQQADHGESRRRFVEQTVSGRFPHDRRGRRRGCRGSARAVRLSERRAACAARIDAVAPGPRPEFTAFIAVGPFLGEKAGRHQTAMYSAAAGVGRCCSGSTRQATRPPPARRRPPSTRPRSRPAPCPLRTTVIFLEVRPLARLRPTPPATACGRR